VSRVLPPLCALALLALLAWQLLDGPTPAPSLERMPIFTPASMGSAPARGLACPGTPAQDEPSWQQLRALPLELLLLAAAALDAPPPQLVELTDTHRELLELRNQRHAWNTSAMELSTHLAATLDAQQLDWILSNRDLVAREELDAALEDPPLDRRAP